MADTVHLNEADLKYADWVSMSENELIKRFDKCYQHIEIKSFISNMLFVREQKKINEQMLQTNQNIENMTGVIKILTIVNVLFVFFSLLVPFIIKK